MLKTKTRHTGRGAERKGRENFSEILRVNLTAAYALARREDFPSLKVGKRIVVPRDAFFRWMEREAGENV